MKKSINATLATFVAIIFIANFLPSCSKDKDPTCAQVFVENKNGGAINGAKVVLHQRSFDPDPNDTLISHDIDTTLYFKGFTDEDGRVTNCYELEAIWEILVITTEGKREDGFIKLVPNETTTEIITIK
ncbi:MAG: hypothetical protein COC01_05840 [Bacteroidetes bacterium]|nr:hypothetical protein [Bacteroidia bacterium]PCH67443.1 MAG: hypothetical protein COC01_05840 [Bacteroidota bacterium]